jgi:large subunit ribosomal protein L6
MSRIGKAPISVPSGVEVNVDGQTVRVKGPKGELSRQVHETIRVSKNDAEVVVERGDDTNESKALHGLTRSLINNMVIGVTNGYEKELEIQGVGYRAQAQGPSKIELALGFSHPIVVDAPEGVTFETPQPTRVLVKGIDKEVVGQAAANIRKLRKPEPYKGKGVRYVGEYVRRKAGKAAK